ncbi:hypothetical protein Rs2_24999 [Raphanus sativus]|uniref:Uncharacterized protein LOC108856562 n=1 Tax=Raphanus sativus TaxID=3726 RepID=A0A9W3BRJ0_RAPSA|nr:uncharacterized protein LOC108856562 [Raphanus sativus]KAJ4898205.1 hypothetical protein Rs2_24999 [Raphanus sativus]
MKLNRGGGELGYHHEALKFSSLTFTPERPRDYLVLFTRFSILTCLIVSISLVLRATFSPSSAPYYSSSSYRRLRFPAVSQKALATPPARSVRPINISHIQFCIAGAAKTWIDRSRYTSSWWRNSTRGFVWLDEPVKIPKHHSDNRFSIPVRVSDTSWTRFRFSSSRAGVRIARVVWDSYRLNLPDVRWFVMGDDDTVFFADNLVKVLSKYDHEQMWYVGGNSESVEQDVMHDYDMAFGGGGFAISRPLAARLAAAMDGCLQRYFYFYGSDQRIAACVSEIGVPFTEERGFHQLDIRGDPYGFLSAHPLAPLVSLHHLDYLDPLFPNKTPIESLQTLMKPYTSDPHRILQQINCHDHKHGWSISISWGYSIQIYTYFLSAKDLETPLQTFKTWRSFSDGPFTFNTRPLRPDPCERPVTYFMDGAEDVRDSGTKTWYSVADKNYGHCGKSEYSRVSKVKRILVTSMKMDPEYWNKAPRRQCCELLEGGGRGSEKEMSIRIRKCSSLEMI